MLLAVASILAPSTLNRLASSLLPPQPSGSPDLKTPIEAAALLVHAIHTSTGFRLVEPAPPPVAECEEGVKNKLPSDWAAGGSAKYKYKHEQSSLEFVVNVIELGGRGMVAAVAVEDHKSVSFDFLLTDYFSASAFPVTFPPGEPSPSTFAALFSSPTRLTDLVTLYRLNILQPLIPGLRKDGYTELPASAAPSAPRGGPVASGSGANPIGSPTGPYYPDRGGPLGIYPGGPGGVGGRVPPGGMGGIGPFHPPGRGGGLGGGMGMGQGQNPFNIGRSDLDPLGGQIPQFPGFPGTAGPTFGGMGGGGGGMFVGPDHPLFRERFGNDGGVGGVGGGRLWGGDGYLPQGAHPPGARWDPVGPNPNGPPQPGGVGIGGVGGGNGIGPFGPGGRAPGSNAPRGGPGNMDPDWDEMRPPGSSGNDYDAMFG